MNIEVRQDELVRFCESFKVTLPHVTINAELSPFNPDWLGSYQPGGRVSLYVGAFNEGERTRFLISRLNRTLLHELCHHIQWCEHRFEDQRPGAYWGEPLEIEARAFEDAQAANYRLIRVKKPQMRTRFSSLSDAQSRVRAR